MYKVVLLRHGESAWNKENRFTGWVDVELSPKGIKEAETAGVKLKDYKIDKAYTSVLKRAMNTYEIAMKAAGKPIKFPIGDGYNHFEMMETLGNPHGLLGRAALEQMKLSAACT